MLSHFDDLLITTANDGASTPVAVCPSGHTEEVDQLMDAWFQERQERIEASLFLDQARQLLYQIIAAGEITSASRRRARRLLLAIKAARKGRRES